MSGGGVKKKPTKTKGWEEAGSEFYQESYPAADGELDVFQRDPQHLATLLPSKQTRAVATTIQATVRMRTNRGTNDRTIRRQTTLRSRRESTIHRRASTTQDVQVSMLPDLSENISNEQTIWEEIMQIKTMPIPMGQKKELKSKILNQPNLRLQGYEQFKWKRRKLWKKFHTKLAESYEKLELWKGTLKKIEGHFGTGVVSYFLFLKWLLCLNVFIFGCIFTFITLPYILWNSDAENAKDSNSTVMCTGDEDSYGTFLDVIQGTGFMECTYWFYGYYPSINFNYKISDTNIYYNLPLAYILITLVYLIVSLIAMVKAGSKGFKERLIEGEGQFYLYCNLVFGGWDFCIHDTKSATIKHQAIYHEIRANLEAERMKDERQNRTQNEKFRLFMIRFLVNSVVVGILVFCACSIYFIFNICTDKIKNFADNTTQFDKLFFEFLPSMTIVGMNLFVPIIFRYLIVFEHYTPLFVVKLSLIRTVFVRMASLIILYATLYAKITCQSESCNVNKCWETYVGQQIYKLFLTDFVTSILVTFFVNFPRSLLAKHFNNNFFIFIGEQSFDLPKHVLDVIYSQTLCWIGCFYSPVLSLVAVLNLCFVFYIKKFACLVNSKPSGIIYRVSRSNSMFMIVLLVSFIFAVLPLTFSVSELTPSRICGPFQDVPYVWNTIEKLFSDTPLWFQSFIAFLSTAGFAVPVIIVLLLLLYYFSAVNSANRHLVKVLKNQLVLEGHDKQFLLERLSMFIKQQQENQKRMRRIEVPHEADRNRSST
ncbi:hypothetical protein HHI36_019178 [Cryptolaemus montrouzieri]|uniref:TMC domain-containing protein n=1 Tax=Cryptolaemus montrouzieri TaxID=559131 RepID=A0ABD2P283_9CUCU